jgi:hypothetical protein
VFSEGKGEPFTRQFVREMKILLLLLPQLVVVGAERK